MPLQGWWAVAARVRSKLKELVLLELAHVHALPALTDLPQG